MKSLISYLPFSDQAINAIGWTLIHSLWQGLLLVLLTGVVIQFTRKESALVRYRLLIGLLLLFVISVAITFDQQWNAHRTISHSTDFVFIGNAQPTTASVADMPLNSTIWDQISGFINAYASWIVAAWLLITCLRLARLGIQFGITHQLRTRHLSLPTSAWQTRFQQMVAQLQIHQSITLAESRLATMPMAVGLIKPVVLVPLGMLSQLSAQEVEAILWHELAHLKRNDFAVNLLQHGLETIFFFNPAVLWVSSLIRDERENCCDDLAVNQLGNRKHVVKALIAFHTPQWANASHALAFGGQKYHLLNRAKRILHGHNQPLTQREVAFVLGSLLVTSLLLTAFVQKTPIDSLPHLPIQSKKVDQTKSDDIVEKSRIVSTVSVVPATAADVIPATKAIETVVSPTPAILPTLSKTATQAGNRLDQFWQKAQLVDPQNRFQERITVDTDTTKPAKKSEGQELEVQKQVEEEIRQHKEHERQLKVESDLLRQQKQELQRMKELQLQKQAGLQKHKQVLEQELKSQQDAKIGWQKKQATTDKDLIFAKSRLLEEQRTKFEKDRQQLEGQRAELEVLRQQLERQKENLRQKERELKPIFDDMISFLQAEGIIKDAKDLSFKISNNELIVNYQRQSAALLEKFLKTHKIEPGQSLLYNFEDNRMR